mmetsp:Transcript_1931/g.3699  ORF Transcript_1931/g.3699 Transcript_1931/m.3699 type:complete len:256 (+) Transcript_1931:37-804(+)
MDGYIQGNLVASHLFMLIPTSLCSVVPSLLQSFSTSSLVGSVACCYCSSSFRPEPCSSCSFMALRCNKCCRSSSGRHGKGFNQKSFAPHFKKSGARLLADKPQIKGLVYPLARNRRVVSVPLSDCPAVDMYSSMKIKSKCFSWSIIMASAISPLDASSIFHVGATFWRHRLESFRKVLSSSTNRMDQFLGNGVSADATSFCCLLFCCRLSCDLVSKVHSGVLLPSLVPWWVSLVIASSDAKEDSVVVLVWESSLT